MTAQYPVIHDYFSRVRGIPLPPLSRSEDDECLTFFRNLGAVLQDYEHEGKQRCEIAIPLLGVSGELVEILKIELDPETNQKIGKRLLFDASRPRAITFGPVDAHEAVIVEGIEDALTLRWCLQEKGAERARYVVSCGANGYQYVMPIVEAGRPGSVVVVCDADKGGEGIRKSATLGSGGKLLRFVPAGDGPSRGDANDAVRRGGAAEVERWFFGLRRVEWEEVEELHRAHEEKELVLGEEDSHEFHRLRYPDTDAGAAKFFAMRFGKRVRITEDGRWWTWSGRVWGCMHAEGQIRRWIAGLAPVYEREAQRLGVSETVAEKKADLLKFAKGLGGAGRQSSVMQCLRGEPAIQASVDDFDARPDLLNVQNGVLNLANGELLKHDPGLLCSKIARVRWDETATAPTWDRFLEEICTGDRELVGYKLRQLGYAASGYTGEKAFFFHVGTGDNGKSVEAEVIQWLLGSYATTVSTELFLERRYGNDAMYELADLVGVRLVVASETDENTAWSEANIKKFTGGSDRLTARQIRQAPFVFAPRFKPIVHGNNRPRIKSGDPALWKRLHIVPYDFTATVPDPHLTDKLKAEAPGVLRRVVEGFIEWRRAGGLRAPARVVEAREDYRAETIDDIGEFLEARCVLEEGAEIAASTLFAAYVEFTREELKTGHKSQTAFGRELDRIGTATRKSHGRKMRRGIRLIGESESAIDDDFDV